MCVIEEEEKQHKQFAEKRPQSYSLEIKSQATFRLVDFVPVKLLPFDYPIVSSPKTSCVSPMRHFMRFARELFITILRKAWRILFSVASGSCLPARNLSLAFPCYNYFSIWLIPFCNHRKVNCSPRKQHGSSNESTFFMHIMALSGCQTLMFIVWYWLPKRERPASSFMHDTCTAGSCG